MQVSFTSLFHRSFNALTAEQQEKIEEALRLLCGHPYHPYPKTLRVHKLHGVFGTAERRGDPPPPVWEMHASGQLLVTFQYGDNELLFRNCGLHDAVLQSP